MGIGVRGVGVRVNDMAAFNLPSNVRKLRNPDSRYALEQLSFVLDSLLQNLAETRGTRGKGITSDGHDDAALNTLEIR